MQEYESWIKNEMISSLNCDIGLSTIPGIKQNQILLAIGLIGSFLYTDRFLHKRKHLIKDIREF